jgi:Flp pilus assembly protein TadD
MMREEKSKPMRNIVMSLIVAAVLSGCVSNPPKEETKTEGRKAVAISAEARADFDAAMALIKAEEYQKGIELLDKVVEKSQNNPVPYINLGMAHAKLGNLKAAEDNLKIALSLEPDHPVANNEYGLLYRKTGRFNEARQLYEKLLAKYPYYPLVHKNLGILCDIYLRDYECALKEYEFYSGAEPEDKTAKIWIADVQRRLGK